VFSPRLLAKVFLAQVLGKPMVFLLVSVSTLVCEAMVGEVSDAMVYGDMVDEVCGPKVCDGCVGMSWTLSDSCYPMVPC